MGFANILSDKSKNPPIMTISEFEEWVAIDSHLNVVQNITEGDLCENVLCNSFKTSSLENEPLEEDTNTHPPPTIAEMRIALEVLRRDV